MNAITFLELPETIHVSLISFVDRFAHGVDQFARYQLSVDHDESTTDPGFQIKHLALHTTHKRDKLECMVE